MTHLKAIWPLLALLGANAILAAAADQHGPWQVRRGRTTDAATAGGFPGWAVTFAGPETDDAPVDVTIDGDDKGNFRGTILIGRQVTVPADGLLSFEVSYTTHCDLADRCGRWEAVAIDPAAWDKLGTTPDTEVVFDSNDRTVCPAIVQILSHTGADVDEPRAWDPSDRIGFAAQVARLAGREVVLALAWTGLHGDPERASLHGLKLVTVEREDVMKRLFRRLDLDRPDLAQVKTALDAGQPDQAAAALVQHFRARTTPKVPGDPRGDERPTLSDRTREEADGALGNRFYGQPNYGLQQVPDDLDWSFNPGHDPEWTWQFNRHSAWRALGLAWQATRHARYVDKWVALLRDWVAENPPGTPWSWRTIETGIRGSLWPVVYVSFVDADAFAPEDHLLFLNALADHADYLMPAGHFHSGSNWGQIESLGLLRVGSYFPEFRDAATWRDTAWSRIEAEMFAQVLEDGAQVELTTSYHQGVLNGFIEAADIAQAGGATISDAYWGRLERMYEYTMDLSKPDGTQPMLGDSWPSDTRRIVRAGGERFGRADMVYVGTSGKEGAAPPQLDSALPKAGYYVMRTDWVDPEALYCLFDCAHRWGGGHQQPDCLQLNLYAFGRTLLPDSGSYLYYGPERARFARTSSHSTVTVDDQNQNHDAAVLHSFHSGQVISFADGEQTGYPGVVHRRQVLFARPSEHQRPYFLVVDRITGEGEHTLDQYWHFLPGHLELVPEEYQALASVEGGPGVLVQAVARDGVAMDEVPSEVSFVYTQKEPRPAVRYRHAGPLPWTFVTLLLPWDTYPPAMTPTLVEAPDGVVAVSVETPYARDVAFFATEPQAVELPGWRTSGRAGLRRWVDGKVTEEELVDPGEG